MRIPHRDRATAPWRSLFRQGIGAAVVVSTLALAATTGAAQSQGGRPQAGQAQVFTPRDESPEEFPAGRGRDETFYACTACHGFKLVAQQGLNRRQWEESLDWMTAKHGMPKLEGGDRKLVVDYLEATYPPRAPAGRPGTPNPFLNR